MTPTSSQDALIAKFGNVSMMTYRLINDSKILFFIMLCQEGPVRINQKMDNRPTGSCSTMVNPASRNGIYQVERSYSSPINQGTKH
jgi:hypothetical protein